VIASDAGEHGWPAVQIPCGVLAMWRAEADDLLLTRGRRPLAPHDRPGERAGGGLALDDEAVPHEHADCEEGPGRSPDIRKISPT
jgi:hypothetical protein